MSREQALLISPAELKAIVGDIDDDKVIEILELKPTYADLELAAAWATGNGDVFAKEGRPIAGTAAAILEILTADDEEPELAR